MLFRSVTEEELAAKNKAVGEFVVLEEEEGAVLLRNNNNALPIKANEMTVNLLGRSTVIPYRKANSGGGSGGESVDYLKAMQEGGFTANQTLIKAYNDDRSPKRDGSKRTIGESPISVYTDEVKASFTNGPAIVMLSRDGGESNDLYRNDSEGISQLALHKDERDLMALVKQYKEDRKSVV